MGVDVEVVEAEGVRAGEARGGDVGGREEKCIAFFCSPAYVADNR